MSTVIKYPSFGGRVSKMVKLPVMVYEGTNMLFALKHPQEYREQFEE